MGPFIARNRLSFLVIVLFLFLWILLSVTPREGTGTRLLTHARPAARVAAEEASVMAVIHAVSDN